MDKSYGSVISEIPLFRGPENDPIPLKEQKKIQIDIRRPIRSGKSSPGPIKRGIKDPTKLTLPRREKEGRKCLFDREEIKNWKKEVVGPETRAPNNTTATTAAASSHPSNSASKLISTERSSHRRAEDLRSRLETEGGRRRSSVHSRLGSQKAVAAAAAAAASAPSPAGEKPWDVSPEFVPRGRNYYEHDNREGLNKMRRSRPRPYESSRHSGSSSRRHRRGDHPTDSSDWKHDRYHVGEREFHR
eukprot:TRINITY_DN3253_c0_g1_i1.p1 TRINITY_DN3253_c0_g1~~TRINITY_DN3253_c0_g1_i1.p1  ORF type:complete len:245 (+),score=89.93 TRINITY_DN3253_c0_g1_i1:201-935(+)